ncbi:hypothetical protein [Streptomyces sp. NPDC026589]
MHRGFFVRSAPAAGQDVKIAATNTVLDHGDHGDGADREHAGHDHR